MEATDRPGTNGVRQEAVGGGVPTFTAQSVPDAFSLDTSGSVELQPMTETEGSIRVRWEDLSPFAQGYVEALFASLMPKDGGPVVVNPRTGARHLSHSFAFSDLSPAALSMILGDCEQRLSVGGDWPNTTTAGEMFWLSRQRKRQVAFPPLTVSLSEDGKVVLTPTLEETP